MLERVANHVRSLRKEEVTWETVKGVVQMLAPAVTDQHSLELYQGAVDEMIDWVSNKLKE